MKSNNIHKLEWGERFTYLKSVPFDEKDLRSIGTKFQIVRFKPHTSIEPHHHKKTCEIFYIKRGGGILKINKKEFRCTEDDFFLCEPGDIHEFINDTSEEFVILVFKTNETENDIYWD